MANDNGEQQEHQLDEVCIALLKLIAQIDAKKRSLGECLRDGYFLLAQSRKSVGKERLSSTYYSPEMKASTMVKCNTKEGSFAHICRPPPPTTTPVATSSEQEPATTEEQGVHRRKKQQNPPPAPATKEEKTTSMTTRSKLHPDDPIFWFGILLPQSLHKAKECFSQATSISCEICSLERMLERKRALYNSLSSSSSAAAAAPAVVTTS